MATIVDVYGNPLNSQVLDAPQSDGAHVAGLKREFAGHPSRNLTPAKLARILETAELGNLQGQSELFMDMEERDAHLFAEMSKRKRALLPLDWRIEPPRDASAREKADAQYLTEVLADIDSWEDLLVDLADGIGHGFSAIEYEWERLGAERRVRCFHHRPQTWFQLPADEQNELRLRGAGGTAGGGVPLAPFGWAVHRPKARSGYVARTGLFRVLAWPYLFKHYATRDLAELLEIYGLPIRLGKYPPGTADAEKASLMRAVIQLGHSAAGIIPEGMGIEFQKASEGSEAPFLSMMRWADDAMSKAVLGGTLTSQTSETGGGAMALGNVHNEVRHDLMAGDARQLAGTLSRDLLWPLLALNRPGNDDPRRAPRLVFETRDPTEAAQTAANIQSASSLGIPVPLAWARSSLGIPEPQNGEPVLHPAPAAPAFGSGPASAFSQVAAAAQALMAGKPAPAKDGQDPPTHQADQLADQVDPAVSAWIDQIRDLVEKSDSLEEIRDGLLALMPTMNLDKYQQAMRQALAAAALAGRYEVLRDAGMV
jgi:phage gp29-like protein